MMYSCWNRDLKLAVRHWMNIIIVNESKIARSKYHTIRRIRGMTVKIHAFYVSGCMAASENRTWLVCFPGVESETRSLFSHWLRKQRCSVCFLATYYNTSLLTYAGGKEHDRAEEF
jgi:hypothetical protein